jgi:transposase-like protein
MSQRREFVELAQAEGTNKRGLCRRFGISPTTGYKWLGRFREGSEAGLVELLLRPHYSPARTPSQVEQAVLSARAAHPAWGARKLRRWLLDRRDVFEADMPAPSTITAILRRHGRIDPAEGPKHVPGSDLNTRHPTTCGRWTSKATSPLPEDAATL